MTERFSDHFVINGKTEGATTSCVDVVVAARDRADTIQRAVRSALAQEEVRAVIVVDDGSTDDTAARARECDLEGKRVWVERLRLSLGPSAARNIAIEKSQASWLDFWSSRRAGMYGVCDRILSVRVTLDKSWNCTETAIVSS